MQYFMMSVIDNTRIMGMLNGKTCQLFLSLQFKYRTL